MMNYDLAREDFINMGEVTLRSVYEVRNTIVNYVDEH
jgi:hypothetical protein